MNRTFTAAEKRHLAKVAEMDCIVCRECLGYEGSPAEIHHVRVNHGWGRSGHKNVIPVCPTHHRGAREGIHGMGRDEFTAMYGYSELQLLEMVNERIGVSQC